MCTVYKVTLCKENRLCNITNFKEKQAQICCMTLTRWLEKGFSDLIRRVVVFYVIYLSSGLDARGTLNGRLKGG